jgi:iron complex outermembrane receptor protein
MLNYSSLILIGVLTTQTSPGGTGRDQMTSAESEPSGLHQVVVVTPTRNQEQLLDTISMVSVLPMKGRLSASSFTLDDQLRRFPGFSLFRRSSSLTAHPTTQGVSLRGIGPSGTSRSLVLWDGIPLNDPFGNWVYWNRIPPSAIQAVEIARGATSQLYGSTALGGTLQLRPREPTANTIELQGQFGNKRSYDLNVFASDTRNQWGYLMAGRLFDTEGYIPVRKSDQGAVDIPAGVQFQSFLGRVHYGDFHAGVNLYNEKRSNGTTLQQNDSQIYLFETGIRKKVWEFNFYAQKSIFNNAFSRILPDRSQEFLTVRQHFPTIGLGSSFSVRTKAGTQLGIDWRHTSWNGRDQNIAGLFLQHQWHPNPRLEFLLGGRLDAWKSHLGRISFNPRGGIRFRASENSTLRASFYRGFRAPSLNELYRPFRVGNTRTASNPNLTEEYLWGGEGGIDFHPSGSVLVRLNGFWNRLRDPVANVTVEVTHEGIFRQRQNLGSADFRGVEMETLFRLSRSWIARGAYLLSRPLIMETGLLVPQVPRHQSNLGLGYFGPIEANAAIRLISNQFEDDLNQLPLKGFGVLDLSFRAPLSDRLYFQLAIENVFDSEYAVARTPVEKLGTPRLIHGGLVFDLGW